MSKKRKNVNHKLLTTYIPQTKAEFSAYAKQLLSDTRSSHINTANLIIKLSQKYDTVFVSQTLIADILGRQRETVNRAVSFLHKHSIIIKEYRGVNRTCIYKLHPWLLSKESVMSLKELLPSLKSVLLATLLVSMTQTERALAGLPQEAVEYSHVKAKSHRSIMEDDNGWHYHSNLKDDIAYRFRVAWNYCKEKCLKVDWKLMSLIVHMEA